VVGSIFLTHTQLALNDTLRSERQDEFQPKSRWRCCTLWLIRWPISQCWDALWSSIFHVINCNGPESIDIHEYPILPQYFSYSKPQGADPARLPRMVVSVATRAASKDLRTVSLVSTSVRVQLHGLRTKGGFWNGSDVDAHAVNTWKFVVAFGYVWILSVFHWCALKRLEYQDLDHMMPSLGLMPRGKGPGDPSEPPTTGFTGHMVELDHFCQIP